MIPSSLKKKERLGIFRLFLKQKKLTFTAIEKKIGIRSNMIAYHLQCMQQDSILDKKGSTYALTAAAERLIPYFQQELSPLPVILVMVRRKDNILLLKRTKRPYANYWGFIGGRIQLQETISQAAIRLVSEKGGIQTRFKKTHAILHEHTQSNSTIKHSFFLILTSTTVIQQKTNYSTHGDLQWFSIHSLPQEMIPSDRWFIENKKNSTLTMNRMVLSDDDETLTKTTLE